VRYPKIVRVRQHFERPRIDDIAGSVRISLERLGLEKTIRPGQTVALTAGSRGIANIPVVLRQTVSFLKGLGARPFLVPTMGSHGGGTADGQRKVLESYGITAEAVGAPIRASMDVITVGNTPDGFPVYLDKHASEADHIGVVARIKPHTRYCGPIESGLLKMMMIGLGKHTGAIAYHRILLESPYDPLVREVCRTMLANAPVAFGLAVVENAFDETAQIDAILPADFERREEELLVLAKRWLPKLPARKADLLIVDEIGKDISGSGMDTNVVGRKLGKETLTGEKNEPLMRHIFVRGLSAKTHGNAAGIGLADFTTARLVQSMNYRATVINCLTAGYPDGASLPVHFETDKEVVDASLAIGRTEPEAARVIHIRDTLHVEEAEISEACLDSLDQEGNTEFIGSAAPMKFDAKDNLLAI
jgi:hypothetical protein